MDRLARGIIRHNKLIIIVFIVLTLVSVALFFGVSVNYKMADYLPDDAPSTRSIHVMQQEFDGSIPNARVMISDIAIDEAVKYKTALAAIPGVTDVIWLDDIVDVRVPLSMADQSIVEAYYKDHSALFSIAIAEGQEKSVLSELYALIGENGAAEGEAVSTATMQQLSRSETSKAAVLLVPVILLILLLTTGSFFEPVLFLCAIGASVLINMGTNIIFGEISFMTNSVSPILQLAVSLDYAIFLLHNFERFRAETTDVKEAMVKAVKRSAVVVLASALTTVFGFLVLTLMRFKIGPDLGLALGKGVALSLLSVIVFLPALTLACYKFIDKTKHRLLMPSFKGAGKFSARVRVPALLIVAVLFVPAFLAQGANTFTYGSGVMAPSSRAGQDQTRILETFGAQTPIVVLVPRGDIAREKQLANDIANVKDITSVVSYANMVGAEIPSDFLTTDVTEQFYSKNYARLIVYADTPAEGDRAFAAVEGVRNAASNLYGDAALACGQSVSLYDMRSVVVADNSLVSLLAVIAIGMTILVSFKSLSIPLILVFTIETAIWINLSTPYFMGSPINFIGFLVISTVQLGSTVDYAILYTDHYMQNRLTLDKRHAAGAALSETMGSILVSGGILSLTGFMLSFVSTNPIVSELGLLLGRGTLLSMAMVFFFLPAMLTLCDFVVQKTTLLLPMKGRTKHEKGHKMRIAAYGGIIARPHAGGAGRRLFFKRRRPQYYKP